MALGLTPQQIIDKDTHALLKIHPEWKRIELHEVAIVQNGSAFSSKYFNREKGLPLIRIRDILSEETENLYDGPFDEAFIVKHHDILVGMDGDFKVSRWPGIKGLLNQRVCRLKFSSDVYEEGFFFFCLQPYLNAINEETSSVTVKHLSSRTIQSIPLPLPPLPEQRTIVARLEQLFSELDSGVKDLLRAQDKLKVYRQAVLKKAFEGELTKAWRDQQKDLPSAEELLEQIKEAREAHYEQQLKEWKAAVKQWEANGKEGKKPGKPKLYSIVEGDLIDEFPQIPREWSYAWLNQIADKITDGEHITPRRTDAGYLLLSARNVQNGFLDLTNVDYIPEDEYQRIIQRCHPEESDILISCSGSVGRICLVPKDIDFTLVRSAALVKLQSNPQTSRYLLYALQSPIMQKQIDKGKKATAQANLFLGPINKLKVPYCSHEEQHQIVQAIESRLSVCDKLEESINTNLQKAEALRQSILKKAFEGRLLSAAEIAACKKELDWCPAGELLAGAPVKQKKAKAL